VPNHSQWPEWIVGSVEYQIYTADILEIVSQQDPGIFIPFGEAVDVRIISGCLRLIY
jgi:hypothetical protein